MLDFQQKIDEINDTIYEHITKKVEEVALQYSTIVAEKDREIEGLRGALKQSAKDFDSSGIQCLVREAHETAKEKGWWDSGRSPLELHMLMVSEIAEATEAARRDDEAQEKEELADVVIRIFDYFGHKGWDLAKALRTKMDYNRTRPYRHGGKKF